MYIAMYLHIYRTSVNTGNSGPHLTDSGSVYVTRDGGLTWEKVINEICTYACHKQKCTVTCNTLHIAICVYTYQYLLLLGIHNVYTIIIV